MKISTYIGKEANKMAQRLEYVTKHISYKCLKGGLLVSVPTCEELISYYFHTHNIRRVERAENNFS